MNNTIYIVQKLQKYPYNFIKLPKYPNIKTKLPKPPPNHPPHTQPRNWLTTTTKPPTTQIGTIHTPTNPNWSQNKHQPKSKKHRRGEEESASNLSITGQTTNQSRKMRGEKKKN